MKFQYEQMMGSEESGEPSEVNGSGSDRLVIASGSIHVVEVKASEAVRELFEQRLGVEQTEAPLDFSMPGIVPVGDLRRIEAVHERAELGIGWQFEYPLAILDREPEPRVHARFEETSKMPLDPVESRTSSFPESLHGPLPPRRGLVRHSRERRGG